MNTSEEASDFRLVWLNDSVTNETPHYLSCVVNRNRMTFGSIRITFAVLGILVNTLFIVTMIKNTSLRNPLMLVTLMSFGDLIVSIFIFTLGLNELINDGQLFLTHSLSCFYLRPHLSFVIWGILIQSVSIALVAIQRTIAIMKPLLYYKKLDTKFLLSICLIVCLLVLIVYLIAICVAASNSSLICSNMCWPSVVSDYFAGFLYAISACLGLISVFCYALIFAFKFYERYYKRKKADDDENNDNFGQLYNKREMWLMQICCILTFTAFFCVILPHSILLAGIDVRRPTSIVWYLRKYVSFMIGTNTFLGMTISFAASRDLRHAVKTTLLCKEPISPVDSMRSKSSSFGERSSISKTRTNSSVISVQFQMTI